MHDLVEGPLAPDRVELRLYGPRSVRVVPGIEHVEGDDLRLWPRLVRLPAQPAVDVASGLLAVPDPDRDGAFVRHHVAAGEDPLVAGHHVRADLDHTLLDIDPRDPFEQREVGVLAEREDYAVRLELLELAGRLREAGLVELHLLDYELALVRLLDGGEPAHHHALLLGLLDLEVVGGHALARAPVDHHRLL